MKVKGKIFDKHIKGDAQNSAIIDPEEFIVDVLTSKGQGFDLNMFSQGATGFKTFAIYHVGEGNQDYENSRLILIEAGSNDSYTYRGKNVTKSPGIVRMVAKDGTNRECRVVITGTVLDIEVANSSDVRRLRATQSTPFRIRDRISQSGFGYENVLDYINVEYFNDAFLNTIPAIKTIRDVLGALAYLSTIEESNISAQLKRKIGLHADDYFDYSFVTRDINISVAQDVVLTVPYAGTFMPTQVLVRFVSSDGGTYNLKSVGNIQSSGFIGGFMRNYVANVNNPAPFGYMTYAVSASFIDLSNNSLIFKITNPDTEISNAVVDVIIKGIMMPNPE